MNSEPRNITVEKKENKSGFLEGEVGKKKDGEDGEQYFDEDCNDDSKLDW